MFLWSAISLLCAGATVAGYSLLGQATDLWLALIQAFAAGAILMMLANTMIPEAYAHAGRLAGVFAVLDFVVSVIVVLLERT